ncbi:hypothetical protein TNCT_493971 [Trichonephila clavata]|uniref:Uncharacterized protein n=1 Tax=Trichonephila clavata TaxID=2740835 RepID=A0A8X6HKF4_TRICU|nr:hypothetical protein TNCT_493971 [Trichonephila clavata]
MTFVCEKLRAKLNMLCRMAKEHIDFVKEYLGCCYITAKDVMNAAVLVVKSITKCSNTSIGECGISVDDDTWTFFPKSFYRTLSIATGTSRLGNYV